MNTLLRILIVDDSEDDAKLMIRQLHKGGYDPKWERVETAEAMRPLLTGSSGMLSSATIKCRVSARPRP